MRILVLALTLACACTNVLLLADWAKRGEAYLAAAASAILLLCGAVFALTRRLRT